MFLAPGQVFFLGGLLLAVLAGRKTVTRMISLAIWDLLADYGAYAWYCGAVDAFATPSTAYRLLCRAAERRYELYSLRNEAGATWQLRHSGAISVSDWGCQENPIVFTLEGMPALTMVDGYPQVQITSGGADNLYLKSPETGWVMMFYGPALQPAK